VLGLVGLFAYFLTSLSSSTPSDEPTRLTRPLARQVVKAAPKKASKPVKSVKKTPAKYDIQYDFYTILPEAEFVIPDHEVKTRKREERVGKAKSGVQYSVQAGAFRKYKDADSLKAKLLMMGFSPKIEKAVIGSATWYRVKMGPYNQLASVDAIQSRLKSNKMDALVIEVKK
jgi:cell division protein FtsN